MRIDLEDLRRHYSSLSDGALLALDRAELTDAAKMVYDDEVAARQLMPGPEGEEALEIDAGEAPEWLDDAACACTFAVRNRYSNDAAADACACLGAADIPYYLVTHEEEPTQADAPPRYLLQLMVPHALILHASSVLDRDIFNEEQEGEWRAGLEMLSDDELLALNPDIFCAGLLDRVDRLRRAYQDEMARREIG